MAGVGDGVVAVALLLLAAGVTRDPLAIAAVVAAQQLPWAVVQVAWRHVRTDRRTIIGLIDTVRALALGFVGYLSLTGHETILGIQLVALVIGLGEALTDGAETEAADVTGLSARGMVGMAVVGLPLGGILYEVYPATPFLLEVLAFAVAGLLALLMRRPVRPPIGEGDVGAEAAAPGPPGSLPVTISAACGAAAGSAVLGVLVLYALDDLGLGAPAFGLLLAGIAMSTAAGGFAAPEVGRLLGVKPGLVVGALLAAVGLAAASQIADAEQPWLGAVALGAAGGAGMVATVLGRALLQVTSDRPLTGPTLRRFHLVVWTVVPLGALAGGWLATQRSVHEVLAWAAGAWVAAALAVLFARPERTLQ